MCIKVVERYGYCRCIFYSHAVDPCPAYGRRGHSIKTQEILVGYSCSRHSSNFSQRSEDYRGYSYLQHQSKSSQRSEDYRAGNSLDTQEDRVEEAVDLSACSVYEAVDASENSENPQAGDTMDGQENCVEESTIKAPTDSLLRGRLLAKLQKIPETHESFIPTGDLKAILTGSTIERELEDHDLRDLSSHVLQHAQKLFTILLIIGSLDLLRHLVEQGFKDELLPLAASALLSPNDAEVHSAFSKWDLEFRKKFFDSQWTLLTPVFSEGQHLKLDDNVRLPFIETKRIANGIYNVKIHSDHETFQGSGLTTSQSTRQNVSLDCLK